MVKKFENGDLLYRQFFFFIGKIAVRWNESEIDRFQWETAVRWKASEIDIDVTWQHDN